MPMRENYVQAILCLFYFYIMSNAAGPTGWAGCAGLAACCVVLGSGLGWGGWAAPGCPVLLPAVPGSPWLLLAAAAVFRYS